MSHDSKRGIDWRDAAAYAPLLNADRALIAWEWLRRDPKYLAAAAQAAGAGRGATRPGPETFGLVRFEPPSVGVPLARPMWRSEVCPFVLRAERVSVGHSGDAFDFEQLNGFGQLEVAGNSEHVLISDGLRLVRLDGSPGTFTSGPARLRFSIEGVASARVSLLALQRFLALARSGRFSNRLHLREPRARRWVLMLRAFDALGEGATLRQIAAQLLRASAAEPLWRLREPSIRSQAQRLVRGAGRLAGGDYRRLLD